MKKFFFFGNYFYGICVVGLSIESIIQQQISFPPIIYFCFIFCVSIVFYTKAYISEAINSKPNERSIWYVKNKSTIFSSQVYLTVFIAVLGVLILPNLLPGLRLLTWKDILLLSLFPFVGLLYYGFTSSLSLRKTHWLKPFVIGFVWSGIVTLAPLFYNQIQNQQQIEITFFGGIFFIKNLMYVAVLSIMFDIKDYASDYNEQLKTFVVSYGLRKTIFFILIPLILIGYGSLLYFAFSNHFSIEKIMINSIPFVSLIAVAYSMHQRRSIFYYLIIIDGLMLLKAICGSLASYFFN